LHKTLTALRELYNTRNVTNWNLPYGELSGSGFGLNDLQFLLLRVARHDPTLEDIDQRFQKAYHPVNCDVEITETVHWATDRFMDLMNKDATTKAEFADWGLKMMKHEKERLQAYTIHMRKVMKDTGRILEVNTGTHMMQQMLRQFFEHICEHHKRVPDSRIGVDEILEVGKETDFIRRGAVPAENVHHLFDTLVSHGMPMFQCLDMVAQVIERQLKERDHPIPAEFALVTTSKAIPQVDHTVLRAMPLESWSEWLRSIGLSCLGNILTERVSEALAAAPAIPSTPEVASSAWLNIVGFNRPPNVISTSDAHTRAHVKKKQRGPDGESLASFGSLFTSASEVSQDIQSPTTGKTRAALGEISQGRANDASTSSKTT
jgi:hypothetical protein